MEAWPLRLSEEAPVEDEGYDEMNIRRALSNIISNNIAITTNEQEQHQSLSRASLRSSPEVSSVTQHNITRNKEAAN